MRRVQTARAAMSAAVCLALLALGGCEQDSPAAPSPLSVTCSASPAAGPAPLTVGFSVTVAGAQSAFSVAINYGDGRTGTEVAVPHTYSAPGTYTVAFTVTSGSQSALCSTVVRADAPPAPSPTPTPVNQAPIADFRTNPDPGPNGTFSGKPPLTITFNMCRSVDPEGDRMNFRMDFEGDGIWNVDGPTGGDCRRDFTYGLIGTYTPRICVTDLASSLAPAHPYQCQGWAVVLTK